MKPIQQKIIIAFSVLLVVVIVSILYYSSTYKSNAMYTNAYENFETTTTATTSSPNTSEEPAPLSLSEKEQTLFDDLLSNKLTDVNIQSLIESGFLTEKMIEKFYVWISFMTRPSTFRYRPVTLC